ncbi:TIGR00730 family Rossman fold protein [Piscinibacter sakaiensis]|uniref:LOG family protein n=1 Tax=Piscinibacter sakaiensis TaxID=1547922 RepID=UPI00372967AB
MHPLSICVYCGSRDGRDPAYAAAAEAVGTAIGRRGWRLVYGRTADAALAAGARVLGVIPQTLMALEVGHAGLDELVVVDTMHERKRRMAEAADAFLALPGGIGTFEELFEVWTWRQLGYHDKPVGLLNVAGYYDRLLGFLDSSRDQGLMSAPQRALLEVDDAPGALLDRLGALARQADAPDDYRRI